MPSRTIRKSLLALAISLAACAAEPGSPPVPENLAQLDPDVRVRVQDGLRAVQGALDDAARWARLGRIYEANGLFSSALAAYEGAQKLAPRDSRLAYRRAVVLDALDRVPEAEISMRRAIDLGARHAPAHWRIGRWRIDAGDLEGARAAFEAARDVDPRDPASYLGLARVHLLQGQAQQAVQAAQSALRCRPDDPHALQLLGSALQRVGRDTEAAAALARAAGRYTAPVDAWQADVQREVVGYSVTLDAAQAAVARGDLQTAIPILEALVRERPQDSGLLNHLGLAYGRSGRAVEAVATLQRALDISPKHLLTHLNLAVVQTAGDRAAAMQHLQTALAIDPDFTPARNLKGVLLEMDGRLGEAAEAYELALASDGRQHDMRLKAGLIRLQLGQNEIAQAHFEEVLRSSSPAPNAWAGLAIAQARLGLEQDARASLARAQELSADDALVRSARAAIEESRQ